MINLKKWQRVDDEFDEVVEQHAAKTPAKLWLYVFLHLFPGVVAWYAVYHWRIPLMDATGMNNRYANLTILATMAFVWHMGFPLLVLKVFERMTWREVWVFLGLHRIDIKGILTTFPLITLAFVVISFPYVKWVHPLIYGWLNQFDAIGIRDWHMLSIGYYDFPPLVLAFVFIGNFVGEEVYFRGFLQSKLSRLRYDWVVCAFLFEAYHVWQAPMNWAFFPIAPLIPFNILMKLRKSLYSAMLFHIFANLFWDGIVDQISVLLHV